jgi:hypothetical protein
VSVSPFRRELHKLERLPVALHGPRGFRVGEDPAAGVAASLRGACSHTGGAKTFPPVLVGLPFEFAAAAAANLRFRAARH